MEQTACQHFNEIYRQFHNLDQTVMRLAASQCGKEYRQACRKRSYSLAMLYTVENSSFRSGFLRLIRLCSSLRKTAVYHGFCKGISSAAQADKGILPEENQAFLPALCSQAFCLQEPSYWNKRREVLALEKRLNMFLSKEQSRILSLYLEAEEDIQCAESHCGYWAGWQAGCITAVVRNSFSAVKNSGHSLFLSRYYHFQ